MKTCFFLIRIKGRLRFRRVDVSLHKTCSKELATSLKLFFFLNIMENIIILLLTVVCKPKINVALRKKIKFPLKDSLSKYDQICSFLRFGHIYWRNASWKTYPFVQCSLYNLILPSSFFIAIFNLLRMTNQHFYWMFLVWCTN